jgi:hypothetical protein
MMPESKPPAEIIPHPGVRNPPKPKTRLQDFALDWDVEACFDKMKADVFVLDKLAIRGDITVIHGPPMAGKTLITMRSLISSIREGRIEGRDVFYINADDNYKGLLTKLRIAQKVGFWMLAPGHKDFNADKMKSIMAAETRTGAVEDKIIILDTLKKFADTMNKSGSAKFLNLCREFAANGGTIIALAHANKHRDASGKLIHSGVQDLVDDADCSYMLDVTNNDGHTAYVEFENKKCRGDNEARVTYTYRSGRGISYQDRLASVKSLSEDEERTLKTDAMIEALPANHRAVFDYLLEISPRHATPKEISDATGVKDTTLKQTILGKMVKDGFLDKCGYGNYEISGGMR